ncbi:hypothetical protein CC1G_12784 [Coprinopsis cinerea okayama7|uniref:Uncharacterized protein n=1 Tax=Coprinopsis cinerea (strain Okayama-7 / 130 / ATCC MYA-4618 / FGSC 9003) TaxID=240176 RepID=A8PHU1_COPC7|nr:hypothetical protein CC1G_12784 [Coprinopsis cinerea okayama7\|eukprot:XP_001841464.2 hypothetical protein CC1G_12784 [Coprinopsis cinerea okayama7\
MPKDPPPVYEPYMRPVNKDGKRSWYASDIMVYYILPEPLKPDEVVSRAGDLKLDRTKAYYWVAGSPNVDWIPFIPKGWRVVQARADGRYGEDDRTQYPIYAVDGYLYTAAMPTDVPERPLLKFTPYPSDCPLISSYDSSCEVRMLKPGVLERYRRYRDDYARIARDYLKEREKLGRGAENSTFLKAMVTHMDDLLMRLETCPMTYKELLLANAEFQCACLDIHAWVDFMTIFLPRTQGVLEPGERPPEVDTNRMGAITEDWLMAQRLYRMGLPCFYLQPSFRVLKHGPARNCVLHGAVHPRQPTIVLDHYKEGLVVSPYPPIAEGTPSPELYRPTQRLGCAMIDLRLPSGRGAIGPDGYPRQPTRVNAALQPQHLATFSPFTRHLAQGSAASASQEASASPSTQSNRVVVFTRSSSSSSTSTGPSSSSQPLSTRSLSSSSISPTLSTASHPIGSKTSTSARLERRELLPPLNESQLERFKSICIPFWPQPVDAWQAALKAVDVKQPRYRREGWKLGFGVPDPIMLARADDRATLVLAWLLARPHQLNSLFKATGTIGYASEGEAPELTSDLWRGFFHRLKSALSRKQVLPPADETINVKRIVQNPPKPNAPPQAKKGVPISRVLPPFLPQKPVAASLPALPPSLPSKPITQTSKSARLSSHQSSSSLQSPLASSSSSPSSTPSSSHSQPPSKSKEICRPIAHFDRLLQIASSTSTLSYGSLSVELQTDAVASALTEGLVAEVIWELHETNWRLELLFMDRTKAPSKWPPGTTQEDTQARWERDQQVRSIFGLALGEDDVTAVTPTYVVYEIPNSDGFWSSSDWRIRRTGVRRLVKLMKDWDGCPTDIKGGLPDSDLRYYLQAEQRVLGYYCTAFFEEFGRAPVVPCRLPQVSLHRDHPLSLRPRATTSSTS